jgi:acetoin utilization deacetylase AcuC-like enzyme
MILVSFGFDIHWRDPLGSLILSATGYGKLISCLVDFVDAMCDGKIALVLEGGYDLDAGAACGMSAVAALLNRSWEDPLGPAPQPESSYWLFLERRAREIWNL